MKKFLFILPLITLCFIASAQVQKGKFLVSGSTKMNASFTSSSNNGNSNKSTQIEVTPTFAYFLANNFALGLSSGYNYFKQDDFNYTSRTIMFGPSARFYTGKSKINPFIQGKFGLAYSKEKYSISELYGIEDLDSESDGIWYGIDMGLGFFFNEFVSFDVTAGYSGISMNYKNDSKDKSSEINISLGFSLFL